jgi:hypothetical protein
MVEDFIIAIILYLIIRLVLLRYGSGTLHQRLRYAEISRLVLCNDVHREPFVALVTMPIVPEKQSLDCTLEFSLRQVRGCTKRFCMELSRFRHFLTQNRSEKPAQR